MRVTASKVNIDAIGIREHAYIGMLAVRLIKRHSKQLDNDKK